MNFTNGTCIKGGQVLICMYSKAGQPQVVCGATCPMSAESVKAVP